MTDICDRHAASSLAAAGLPSVAPAWRPWRLLRHFRLVLGGGFVLLLVAVALLAPLLAPYNPLKQDLVHTLQPPGAGHLLGTDDLGRDILSRVLYGARSSLEVGVIAVGIALGCGLVLGLPASHRGGWLDIAVMRVVDALLAFPALVLAIAITAVLGPRLSNAMIAIGIVNIPIYTRLIRGQVLAVRELEYVEAARTIGAGNWRIELAHILPNIVNPVIVQSSLSIGFAILAEASLSFLGLGAQPPAPSWGNMIWVAHGYLDMDPWLAFAPGTAIFLAVFAFNFLGDAIRDFLDPRLKNRR